MNILEDINRNPIGCCFLAAGLVLILWFIYAELTSNEDDEH